MNRIRLNLFSGRRSSRFKCASFGNCMVDSFQAFADAPPIEHPRDRLDTKLTLAFKGIAIAKHGEDLPGKAIRIDRLDPAGAGGVDLAPGC